MHMPSSTRVNDSMMTVRVPLLTLPERYHHRSLPAIVDNSVHDFWPGIQDQYLTMASNCQQFNGVAYVFGYEINRMRNRPGWYWENSYPPNYTYNFFDLGDPGDGVSFLHSFDVIRQQGHMTCNDFGPDSVNSYLGWASGYDKYYRGMFNRIKQVNAIQVNSAEGINTVKNFLFDHLEGSPAGGIVCFTIDAYQLGFMKDIPAGTPEEGKKIVTEWTSNPNHGLTIVGYNDSIRYDVNNDGKFTNNLDITGDGLVDARDWEIGAFKVANCFGYWWGNTGYLYVLYRALALDFGEGGIWNNRVYTVVPDTMYKPLLTMKVTLNYNSREKIRILAGVSADTLHDIPDHMIDFPIFNFQGGDNIMQGKDTVSGAETIEFGLDVTPLLNEVASGQPARYYLAVEERDPGHAGFGTIQHASFINYGNGAMEYPVAEENVTIADNNVTFVSTTASMTRPDVRITTDGLPPVTPGQPYQVQLAAAGGRPPYRWSVMEDYTRQPFEAAMPQISGTSLYVQGGTQTFAAVVLPFHFPFYGKICDTIYVNFSGFISFTPQILPGPFVKDDFHFLEMFPIIAPGFSLMYKYQLNQNDGIWFQADADNAIIRWKASVAGFTGSSTNDFALILHPDGRFEFLYGNMNNQGFLQTIYTGISKGDGQNFNLLTQWNANEFSGKSYRYYPPMLPRGLTLDDDGLLSIGQPDTANILTIKIKATDAGLISGSKTFLLSTGLEVSPQLISDEGDLLTFGHPDRMKLIIKNSAAQALQNLVLKIISADSLLQITDSMFSAATIDPGQTLTIPSAFSFHLAGPLSNDFPVMLQLEAHSADHAWRMPVELRVAAGEISLQPPIFLDGDNNRPDPGETGDLLVTLKNAGALAVKNLELELRSSDTLVTILTDPSQPVGESDAFSVDQYHFQVSISRNIPLTRDIPMSLTVSDSTGIVAHTEFDLRLNRPVAVVRLSYDRKSMNAMINALDNLHMGYDTIMSLPFDYKMYSSVFLILGTNSSGSHSLSKHEGSSLVRYLLEKGNLYMESWSTWYFLKNTPLHPYFKYTSTLGPAYYSYPAISGLAQTFTSSMSFGYNAPVGMAKFILEPVPPAYVTFVNSDNPPKNLEISYHGDDYKTIGSMLDFGSLTDGVPPSTKNNLMQQYLEFFGVNTTGPHPLFHAGVTSIPLHGTASFQDDSFDNVVVRSWEFSGGTPSASNDPNPVIRYDNPGKFDVKLTVSDGIHTKSVVKKNYIITNGITGINERPNRSCFNIYPNPVKDMISIEFCLPVKSSSVYFEISDLTGRQIAKDHLLIINETKASPFHLPGMRPGIYIIKVTAENKVFTGKLIVK